MALSRHCDYIHGRNYQESKVAVTREQVLRTLSTVAVDDEGTNLTSSGRLSEILVDQSRVMFSIAIAAAEADRMEDVRFAAENAVKKLPGVAGVFVSLTADRQAASPAPSQRPASPGPARRQNMQRIPGVKHVVAVASGKGGVGKSTTACNLALGLSSLGLKVGLLDADIYGPSVPKLLGIHGKPRVMEGRILEPMEAYGLRVMSIGFLVDEEAAMIWRGPMVMSAITQMLREVAWGELDVLVVDMPPGTGDAQLTMAQATPLAGAVIVSTPQDLALIDARRGVSMFRRVEIPILGIIENMATFVCPHCGTTSHIFGHGGARHEAERLEVPFLGEVPLNMTIRELSDAGTPVVAADPAGANARIYVGIAEKVWNSLDQKPARAAPAIVIE
jgi:ATP-binding protein involved in chromosome partitioning